MDTKQPALSNNYMSPDPDNDKKKFKILEGHGYSEEGKENLRLPMESHIGTAYSEQRSVVTNSTREEKKND